MKTCSSDIKRKFTNWNSHSICTQITQSQNTRSISHYNNPHLPSHHIISKKQIRKKRTFQRVIKFTHKMKKWKKESVCAFVWEDRDVVRVQRYEHNITWLANYREFYEFVLDHGDWCTSLQLPAKCVRIWDKLHQQSECRQSDTIHPSDWWEGSRRLFHFVLSMKPNKYTNRKQICQL
jgi:hypothetical protein